MRRLLIPALLAVLIALRVLYVMDRERNREAYAAACRVRAIGDEATNLYFFAMDEGAHGPSRYARDPKIMPPVIATMRGALNWRDPILFGRRSSARLQYAARSFTDMLAAPPSDGWVKYSGLIATLRSDLDVALGDFGWWSTPGAREGAQLAATAAISPARAQVKVQEVRAKSPGRFSQVAPPTAKEEEALHSRISREASPFEAQRQIDRERDRAIQVRLAQEEAERDTRIRAARERRARQGN